MVFKPIVKNDRKVIPYFRYGEQYTNAILRNAPDSAEQSHQQVMKLIERYHFSDCSQHVGHLPGVACFKIDTTSIVDLELLGESHTPTEITYTVTSTTGQRWKVRGARFFLCSIIYKSAASCYRAINEVSKKLLHTV